MRIKEEYKVREMAGEHIVVMQGRYGVDMTKVIALNETSLWLTGCRDVSSVPTMSAICSSASTTWMRKPPSATPRRGSPGSKRVI